LKNMSFANCWVPPIHLYVSNSAYRS